MDEPLYIWNYNERQMTAGGRCRSACSAISAEAYVHLMWTSGLIGDCLRIAEPQEMIQIQVATGPRLPRQQEWRGLLPSGAMGSLAWLRIGAAGRVRADRSPAINLPYGHGPRSVSQLPVLAYTVLDGWVSGADVWEVFETSCTNLERALAGLAVRDRGRHRPSSRDARGRAVGDIADP